MEDENFIKYLDRHSEISEEELFLAIKDRIMYFLEYNPDLLMSYLYRLDIDEHKINLALSPLSELEPIEGLAQLVLERQKERIASKKAHKQPPIKGWEY